MQTSMLFYCKECIGAGLGADCMHLFPRVDPSLKGYLEPWESRTGLRVVVTPSVCGGCQVPDWRRRRDSSETSMLTASNHLSVAVNLLQVVYRVLQEGVLFSTSI